MKKLIIDIYRDILVMKFRGNEKITKKQAKKIGKKLSRLFDADLELIEGIDDVEINYRNNNGE